MALGEEKLELSMQDLGRLAAFMDGMPGHPLDVFKEWVRIYAADDADAQIAMAKVAEGYAQEADLIHGDGPLRKKKKVG